MVREYLGILDHEDPVRNILTSQVMPQLGVSALDLEFRVYRLGGSNAVFEYDHEPSGRRVVGKFFGDLGAGSTRRALSRMWRELRAIRRMERIGLQGFPHHVARALAFSPEHGSAIFLEHLRGETLGVALRGVAEGSKPPDVLFGRLTALAYFLATMHNRSVREELVEFHGDVHYVKRLAADLRSHQHMSERQLHELERLADGWASCVSMWQDRQVCLHGDATPENFLFTDGIWVGGIDFERSHYGDRVFDVGRVAGELQHQFLLSRGSRQAAEPFIGHFLWEYACHFPDRHAAFHHICKRVPFHMATTLLRIARHPWIQREYRAHLVLAARDAISASGL